jgi:hypothetical protein
MISHKDCFTDLNNAKSVNVISLIEDKFQNGINPYGN